jgi:glycosyltransferase involved in cell wall biosynthesis
VAVVTSNVTSLPEVAGDGAEYADPLSVDSIRGALEKVLESSDLRQRLGQIRRERADSFRWAVTAARTWEFWKGLRASRR